ncbi:MAG TPA: hypothetical protein VFZ22_13280 [Pyrinomonadaceae bacterium]|nr:hypothetical protein [Pyrinomonadaceae bacterium]
MTYLSKSSTFRLLNRAALLGICLLLSVTSIAQTKKSGGDDEPVFLDYRGVQIGWLADDVRKKLGVPADKGDEQDFYKFSDNETCQVLYDKTTRKVTAISVDFTSGASSVITPQQVFGSDIEAKADGTVYKLVRYPKKGYWVSYYRGGGNAPSITITMQKM